MCTHTQSIHYTVIKFEERDEALEKLWSSKDFFFTIYIFLFYLLVVGTRTPLKKTKKGEILCDFSKLINIFHVPTGPYYLLDSAML